MMGTSMLGYLAPVTGALEALLTLVCFGRRQLIYMLPLGEARGVIAYKRLLVCTIAVNVMGMWGRHGRPRFNSAVSLGAMSRLLKPHVGAFQVMEMALCVRESCYSRVEVVRNEIKVVATIHDS